MDDEVQIFDELEQFFNEEKDVGPKLQEKVALKLNAALRPSKVNDEKMKELDKIYKRPENITALQVPKIDHLLWNQLRSSTKSVDIQRQRAIAHLNRAATPLVLAMDKACNKEGTDVPTLKQAILDLFKIIANSIHKINCERRESVKKELSNKFKSLCSNEHLPSDTGLFGDNLVEVSKALQGEKSIQMTNNSTKDHFLGQQRVGNNFTKQNFNKTFKSRNPVSRPENKQIYKGKANVSGPNKAKNRY
ncbi:uncharacterized protein LOC132727805 [Ruditapes philippinarum]|uniref:uncharacterized protein LOC132727805 n=1 Tax=Ruditapes philippinarum TaxID=129788 RepID=UPI00295C06D0|nr:uncharacterized protein LOC132727805 [Ruditapes philippinarum]